MGVNPITAMTQSAVSLWREYAEWSKCWNDAD